jgi:shikimate 5-dehydrogenase
MTDSEYTVVAECGRYPNAEQPTIYFIGVTTGRSSIMKVFPEWADALGLSNATIRGIDFPPHSAPGAYRDAVQHIKQDSLSLGALVTTHKIDLLKACADLFDALDPYARLMGEISCISKRDGKLVGHAKDPITSGLALEAFLSAGYWKERGAEVLVLGAGGSSIAITSYLMTPNHGDNRPSRIIVTNRSAPRLDEIRHVHEALGAGVPCEYRHCPNPQDNDRFVDQLRPRSLVINATGLGKDAPGSPITDEAQFPTNGIAWDFNYRGNLIFLDQARAQQRERGLQIEDGWIYFIHGWTQVVAEVFHIDIPPRGPLLDKLAKIAAGCRGRP